MVIGKALPIRRDLDIQKEVKEDVSGLQNHDRAISAAAKIFHRHELNGKFHRPQESSQRGQNFFRYICAADDDSHSFSVVTFSILQEGC